MKKRKIASYIIDGVLISIIGLFVYTQISMMVTKDKNYGVPKVFGSSILCVVTDSMDDGSSNCLSAETGIVISDVKDITSIKKCNPISYSPVIANRVNDYDKEGDIVTFYYEGIGAPDTHRVIDYTLNDDGSYQIRTLGDNPSIRQKFIDSDGTIGFESWNSKYLIGKVTYASKGLGKLLIISSPSVASSFGKSAWMFPIAIITPIALIALSFMIEEIIKYRKEAKAREEYILSEMKKSNIDMNNEMEVELFKTKLEMKLDMEEEKESIKKKMRQDYEKDIEKQKKIARKAYEKENKL